MRKKDQHGYERKELINLVNSIFSTQIFMSDGLKWKPKGPIVDFAQYSFVIKSSLKCFCLCM